MYKYYNNNDLYVFINNGEPNVTPGKVMKKLKIERVRGINPLTRK